MNRKTSDIWSHFTIIDNTTFAKLSDNANNIKRALSILKLKHFGCFAHTLNLVVQGALILESGLLEKIKTIVSFFHRSTSANNKLNTYQINNGAKEPKKLFQDVNNSPKGLTVDEWKITKELCLVLRPFEEATRAVSGDKYMTASIVIVLSQGLKNVCDELLNQNYDPRVNNVLKKLLSGMQDKDRWGNIENSKTLVCCTFLDPQFKNVPFTESHQQQTKSDIIELITSIISNTSDNEEQPIRISTLPNDSNTFSIWSSINSKVAQVQPVGTNTSKAIIEVQRYLEDGLQPRNTDALKWWKDNKYNYPFMSQLAKKKLCCLGTSVPCERVFSKAGY
ncbi:E3 SUMO-protein ligase ZBED1-like [Daktulosphaira vitifoliae]|uniref:E3 SUMO-protein ligase ZBED1-like n=1 Tax=Daktulosphaira vitifoliae TaxID=58002 RepID=UPI0021AA2990|nr:E3 SUMO-protein ligase ZBED1-like [Daktulosphaira vitifoliae]